MHDAAHRAAQPRALPSTACEPALAAARREGTHPVVMLLDLDRFKEINDTLGHHHGDELLRLIGPRIASVLRSSDTVARLGGDEFAVLLPSAPDAAAGAEVAEKIREALARAVRPAGRRARGRGLARRRRASPATAPTPRRSCSAPTSRCTSPRARARAPSSTRPSATTSPDALALVGDLRAGLDDGELGVVYQPKVDLVTGEVRGVEALVRWTHPTPRPRAARRASSATPSTPASSGR